MSRDSSVEFIGEEQTNWKAIAGVATTVFVLLIGSVLAFDIAVPQRGIGAFTALSARAGLVLSVAGLVTQFGDPWFLLLVAIAVYLAGPKRSLLGSPREGAFVVAVTFSAFALTDLLKTFFLAPRPPEAGTATVPTWLPNALEASFRSITTGSGYAFPSGHALGTTVVVAALAYKLDIGSRALRWSTASVIVFLVAASRVVLGVHFLVDVVAGVFAGVSLFAVAAAIGSRGPGRVFVLGAGIGVLAVLMSAVSPSGAVWNAGQWLGGSIGAGIAWYVVQPSTSLTLPEAVGVGIPVGLLWVAVYLSSPSLLVTVFSTALAAGFAIAAPTLIDRVRLGRV
ncbi:phosphatase PAP2 family protein [Salinigranum sp. GCM10025319]|uniref:phosphatase PAP2 family protein n=1 Tax=Salinigranum sp. GCM10025319 TaxID=3252687 RepID=UPI00360CC0C3